MKSGIYTIRCLIDNKVYIGRSKNWKKRLNYHKKQLIKKIHFNSHIQNAVNKYGIENFEFELLEEYEPKFLCSMENWWCNMLQAHNREYGYNIESTSPFGQITSSQETRNKQSFIAKNRNNETKEKIANSRKFYSLESKIKMSNSQKGKIVSIETKNKMSESHKKRDYSFLDKKVYQYDLQNNFIREWGSIKKVKMTLKISNISSCANNKRKTAGGFKWKFY